MKDRPMFAQHDGSTPQVTAAPRALPVQPRFTPLELRVLRLAASGSERPSSAVEGSYRRLSRRVANLVMARRGGHELADPRLEALRSYAAAIRVGSGDGLPLFFAAGYTGEQADAVKRFIAIERRMIRSAPSCDRAMYASGISIGLASIIGFVAMTGSLLVGA